MILSTEADCPVGMRASYPFLPGRNFHVMSPMWLLQSGPPLLLGKATVLRNLLWLPDFETFLKRWTTSRGLPAFAHSTLRPRNGSLAWPTPKLLTASQAPGVQGALFQVARLGRMKLARQPTRSNCPDPTPQLGVGREVQGPSKGRGNGGGRAKQGWL